MTMNENRLLRVAGHVSFQSLRTKVGLTFV